MNLDLRTLAFILSLTCLTQVIALAMQYSENKTHRGNGWWLLGSIAMALRQLQPTLPVILASGYDKGQVMAGARTERPQAFLSKPFGLRQLREAMDQALGSVRTKGN